MAYSYFFPTTSSKFLAHDAEMPSLSEMGWAAGRELVWDGGEQSKGLKERKEGAELQHLIFPDTFIPQNKGPLLTHTRDWDPCPLSLFLLKFSSFIIIISLPSSLLALYCRS